MRWSGEGMCGVGERGKGGRGDGVGGAATAGAWKLKPVMGDPCALEKAASTMVTLGLASFVHVNWMVSPFLL